VSRYASEPVVAQYCEDVLSGAVVACEPVRQAVQRHLRDLEEGPERGLRFDRGAGAAGDRFFWAAET